MLISFELKGKFAHFRAFYSNATAISYYFPPRTTLVGLVAGILGRERD
ncbi:MAG: CRISPR-associated protein Cas5, partial [candidate division WOR-3 bacterium]|nr:CRISPR-associated protein Cas5 [candidate division WOR-3 bacterium]MDW8151289.1 CRISPR-associated protein Cas5 [candidate division WOR-3 bacterium]